MIIFNQVSKVFADGTLGLQDVSLSISPGEAVLITGPSGAGKTTLMRLLTKEYEPTQGEILFKEQPLSAIRPSKIYQHRRQIGVVFQDYKLLPELNVWENIALALDILRIPQAEIEERITDLLELVELVDKAYLFPAQLSGGEAQRVSIARALAPAPQVVFADEPTGNLDPATSRTIAQLLGKINELGTTLLLATHDQGVLEALPRRTVILENGRLTHDTQPQTAPAPQSAPKSAPRPAPKSAPQTQPQKPSKAAKKITVHTSTEDLDSPAAAKASDSETPTAPEKLATTEATKKTAAAPDSKPSVTKTIKPPTTRTNRITAWLSSLTPQKKPKSGPSS